MACKGGTNLAERGGSGGRSDPDSYVETVSSCIAMLSDPGRIRAMTELARTPIAERRLFQTVDLAPLPQHRTISEALDAWRRRRGGDLAPHAADMDRDQARLVLDHSLIAETLLDEDDFRLRRVGAAAALAIGSGANEDRLARLADRRIAVRLRHLFHLALERGEAVDVRFTDRNRAFEILAAPVRAEGGGTGLFCAIVADPPGNSTGSP